MGTIARTAKAGGGTNFNSGQTIDPAEVNTDFNTAFTEINGNLDDGNIETGTIPGSKSLRFTEISDPSSPSSNDILVYAKDDGAGVTRIYTKDSAGTVRAVGAGTSRDLRLLIASATLPDGSGTINNPPEIVREVSSGQTTNTPKATRTFAKFDASTDEHLCWNFEMPSDYSSGGTLTLIWKAATATSGDVIWKAGIAPTINSSTDDDAVAFTAADLSSASTAPGTQGQSVAPTITLTMTNVTANRNVTIFVGRDADNASDTMTGDAILMAVLFTYTPA